MALQVYLDSSDFSKLSDPSGVPDNLLEIKARLLSFAKSGDVIFRFSSAHIVEMAPVEQIAESAAEARARFLADLCGNNCLLSFDQLMAAELGVCAENKAVAVDVYSNEGNWFPRSVDGLFSVLGEDRISPENFLPRFDGLPREARRRAEREYFKNGKLRAEAKARILKESKGAADTLLSQLPMRACDADVIVRYMIGDATRE